MFWLPAAYLISFGVQMPFPNSIPEYLSYFLPEHITNPNLYHSVECQELLHVNIQHEISHVEEHSALKKDSSQTTYCIHSSCYYLHATGHASWTDAFGICNNRNQHLLTINSDFEARVIKTIMNKHRSLSLSPVLFLNLKKPDKVCTRVVKLLLCAYYYYYYFIYLNSLLLLLYYYIIYLNSLLLLLLLLRHIFRQPITITITITQNIKKAYYYYYYFPDYYYYYYYYFPIYYYC